MKSLRIMRAGKLAVCVIMALALSPVSITRAQSQQSEGENIDSVEQASSQDAIELSRQLALRQAAIEEMQSELGIYSPELQEMYTDLAAFYVQIGDSESAVQLYDNALQIARINRGLESEQQLPLLEKMIELNNGLEQWQKVDDLYHLAIHINGRRYSTDDPQYLDVASSYGEWRYRLITENLMEVGSLRLMNMAADLQQYYAGLVDTLVLDDQRASPELAKLILGKARIELTLAEATTRTHYTAFEGTVSRYIYETRCGFVVNSQGQRVRQCYQVQVLNPRYRQSQLTAKRMEVSRRTRAAQQSIERLRDIAVESESLTEEDRALLQAEVATLENHSLEVVRLSRSATDYRIVDGF